MRRALQDGHTPRPLQEKAITKSCPQSSHQLFFQLVEETPVGACGDRPILKNLLLSTGTAGNLASDAHLAALAIEHGCEIASTDNDFRRFAGVTLVNPIVDG